MIDGLDIASVPRDLVRSRIVGVVEEPFFARGPIATAGGCLASQYLAAWVMASRAGLDAARSALTYAAPVGEKEAYVERVLGVVKPFLPPA